MKKIMLSICLLFACKSISQIVNIPDATFKDFLLHQAILVINTNGDDEIQVSEALATTLLSCNYSGAHDLTGLEAFINLTFLKLKNTSALSGNITMLPNLEHLEWTSSALTSLDFTDLSHLNYVDLGDNSRGTLDLSASAGTLEFLSVNSNFLGNYNCSQFSNLTHLDCGQNNISVLNISGLTQLKYLDCSKGGLTTLDVTGLPCDSVQKVIKD